MIRLRERLAWYRAQEYLARYKPYGIAVAGTYGGEITAAAIEHAIKSHRHVRSGYPVEHSIDIPEGILGARGHREHRGMMSLLVKSKMRELTQFEPDTIITQLPLMRPHAAPLALSKMLPRMLVLTHVDVEQIDLFMNKDMIAHEYLILANTLQRDGVVVLNADDQELRELQEKIDRPVITYGVHPRADVRVTRAVRSKEKNGLFLEITVHGKSHELFLPHLFAKQHVSAVAAGIAASHGMGISPQDAVEGIRLVQPPTGRLSRREGVNSSILIDDSYDTCPAQLASSLKSFATLPCAGRKIIVLGDMDNLASFAPEAHEEAGRQAASIAPIAIFVGDLMLRAQGAAMQSGNKIDVHHFISSSEAAAWLPEHIQENDMVFVSGGKSMKMGKVAKVL